MSFEFRLLFVAVLFCIPLLTENSDAATVDSNMLAREQPQESGLDQATAPEGPRKTVHVEYAPNFSYPYKERRTRWGLQFGIQFENYFPSQYQSAVDGLGYGDLFGQTPIQLISGSIGLKYNFVGGAFTFDYIYGAGRVASALSGSFRSLSVGKQEIAVGYTFDAIFREPYVAPYAKALVYNVNFKDDAPTGSDAATTSLSYGWTAGLLVQLNSWDMSGVSRVAGENWGLNNTFLDLSVTQYFTPTGANDPNLDTSPNWGAGLKLEF